VRAEIKNISGFREIERALSYEIERQKNEIRDGHSLRQETRAWNAEKGVTSLLRTKETEEDYGYIYDPDHVPVEITKEALKKLKSEMPELPHARAKRYAKEYKISEEDAFVITDEYELAEIFEKAIKKVSPILAARWIRRELVRVLNYNKIDVSDMKINERQFIKLLELV
jgi:aspartyl-tRNA(Asn)/glutamyl-tRNA(Gln) amidotransferase subunit B